MSVASYHNVRIWDGVSDTYSDTRDITVSDGLIKSFDHDAKYSRDASGLTVIPGLIDAHVHMTIDPAIFDQVKQLEQTDADIRGKMPDRALKMLKAGITTARDLGGGAWLELELRDAINREEIPGPRLLCAGQPITSIQGHCHFWGGEVADMNEAHSVIERNHQKGVDLIKLMATGGQLTKNSNPGESQFTQDEMTSIVDKARSLSYDVAAHCHGAEGTDRAVHAGVHTIEHCSWMDGKSKRGAYHDPTAAMMAAKGAFVSPTINSGWRRYLKDRKFVKMIQQQFRQMAAHGVRLIASTDAGIPNVYHHDLGNALRVFAHFANLTPVEVLRSATSVCAEAIGISRHAGSIAVGMSADLVFVDGDPLSDLKVLQSPARVVARGIEYDGGLE